jgi:branched-chain amino acid transport system substrate-binding protein
VTTTPLRRAIAGLVGLALVGAACGSDDTTTSTDTAPATVSDASPDQVIRIGVISPLEAGLTEFGNGIVDSVKLAVQQANEAETIPGWTIEVVAVDDSSDPATGSVAITSLIDDSTVVGVVGPYNSGVAAAILPAMSDAGLALVSPSNTLASLTLGDDSSAPSRPHANYFRMVASDALQAPFLAQQIYADSTIEAVAVVSETKPVSNDLADGFASDYEQLGGTVTSRQVVEDGADDFSDVLTKALADEPDAIFFGGEYGVAATLRTQATAAGFTGAIIGGDGIKDPAYITDAGDSAVGTWASSVGTPLAQLESAADYVAAFDAAEFGHGPTDYGPFAYDAANAIIRAAAAIVDGLDSLPADTRTKVITALQATSFEGASGLVGFDDFGDPVSRVFTLYRVEDRDGLSWVAVRTQAT